MITVKVKDLSEIEKQILKYNAKQGITTCGNSVSRYVDGLRDYHPDKIREALDALVEKGYLRSVINNSVHFTDDGIFECRKSFKKFIFYVKYKSKVVEVVKYSLKDIVVPIVVTVLTTLLLHFIFGNPFQSDDPKDEKSETEKTKNPK